jgi:hypothetical protein
LVQAIEGGFEQLGFQRLHPWAIADLVLHLVDQGSERVQGQCALLQRAASSREACGFHRMAVRIIAGS